MTLVEQLIAKSANPILFITGKTINDINAWFFVSVKPQKQKLLQGAVKSGLVDLDSYGQVIESGYGHIPPLAVVKKMKEEFGCYSSLS